MDIDDVISNALTHHGVKGMKWGVRRGRSGPAQASPSRPGASKEPSSEDAAKAHASASKAKEHGTHTLSNHELQHLVNRMNLEQQYTRLQSSGSHQTSKGKQFAKEILLNVAKKQVTNLANKQIAKALG